MKLKTTINEANLHYFKHSKKAWSFPTLFPLWKRKYIQYNFHNQLEQFANNEEDMKSFTK